MNFQNNAYLHCLSPTTIFIDTSHRVTPDGCYVVVTSDECFISVTLEHEPVQGGNNKREFTSTSTYLDPHAMHVNRNLTTSISNTGSHPELIQASVALSYEARHDDLPSTAALAARSGQRS